MKSTARWPTPSTAAPYCSTRRARLTWPARKSPRGSGRGRPSTPPTRRSPRPRNGWHRNSPGAERGNDSRLAEDHVGEVEVKFPVVSPHHVRGGRRITGLKCREQLLVHQPEGLGRNGIDLPRQDDVPLRAGRNSVPVLDQDLIMRSAVDH